MANEQDYEAPPDSSFDEGETESQRLQWSQLQRSQRRELELWFDAGVTRGATHLLVLEHDDGGDPEPYYVYAPNGFGGAIIARDEVAVRLDASWRLRTVLAVYHLGMDKWMQIEVEEPQTPFPVYVPIAESRPTQLGGTFETMKILKTRSFDGDTRSTDSYESSAVADPAATKKLPELMEERELDWLQQSDSFMADDLAVKLLRSYRELKEFSSDILK